MLLRVVEHPYDDGDKSGQDRYAQHRLDQAAHQTDCAGYQPDRQYDNADNGGQDYYRANKLTNVFYLFLSFIQ